MVSLVVVDFDAEVVVVDVGSAVDGRDDIFAVEIGFESVIEVGCLISQNVLRVISVHNSHILVFVED